MKYLNEKTTSKLGGMTISSPIAPITPKPPSISPGLTPTPPIQPPSSDFSNHWMYQVNSSNKKWITSYNEHLSFKGKGWVHEPQTSSEIKIDNVNTDSSLLIAIFGIVILCGVLRG